MGTELLKRLLEVARHEHLARLSANILAINEPMQHICRELGFTLEPPHGDPSMIIATAVL